MKHLLIFVGAGLLGGAIIALLLPPQGTVDFDENDIKITIK